MNDIDIAFRFHDGINFYWNFFVPSSVAVLGWVFSRKAPWPPVKRVTIGMSFAGFVVFNLIGLIKTYVALEAVIAAIKSSTTSYGLSAPVLAATARRLDMGPWQLGIVFHLLVDGIVLYFILFWSGRKIAPR